VTIKVGNCMSDLPTDRCQFQFVEIGYGSESELGSVRSLNNIAWCGCIDVFSVWCDPWTAAHVELCLAY